MNNRHLSLVKTFLMLCLPTTLFAVLLFVAHINVGAQLREPPIHIIGKWRVDSDPTWDRTRNHTFQFYADGRFVEKKREWADLDTMYSVWMDDIIYGYYKLSPKNKISFTVPETWGGRNQVGIESYLLNGITLRSDTGKVSADDEIVRHWHRMKP